MSDYLQVGDLRVGVNMVREYRERIAFLKRENANQKAVIDMLAEQDARFGPEEIIKWADSMLKQEGTDLDPGPRALAIAYAIHEGVAQ